jgi:hypothetical protein
MLKANQERVSYEKKIPDPDHCYFDVRKREAELRAQGMPSQLGILRGMRKVTREDILSGSFEGEDEAEMEPDSDERQPASDARRS